MDGAPQAAAASTKAPAAGVDATPDPGAASEGAPLQAGAGNDPASRIRAETAGTAAHTDVPPRVSPAVDAPAVDVPAVDVHAIADPAHAAVIPADVADTDAADTGTAAEPGDDAVPAAAPPSPRMRPAAVPSFARAAAAPTHRRRLTWELAAIAALCLLLGLQLLLSQRGRLAADAQWRPLLSALCGALRCTLPPWREPDAFRVLERDVRAQAPGVLRVSARIRNDARWAQPWPALRLTLSDADGRAVASRVFQPREYLGGAPTQSRLGSGHSAALRMDLVEPGPQAVAFTFDFQ